MKKRIFAGALVCLMLISSLCIAASAAVSGDVWNNLKFNIFNQTSMGINFAESDTGGMLGHGQQVMRGFTVSPDGAYVFGGYLNPGGTSAVEMFDGKTGKLAGTYVHTEADGTSISYPKGIACDDRGYLYVGLASRTNKSFASFAVVKYDEKGADGWLKEVSRKVFVETSDSVKTGINGVAVREIAGKYYMYIVVNYDVDYLYRFDVTDPANPVADTSFGDNGRIDLQGAPYNATEGNYLDVDEDGTIYLGYTGKKDQGVMVLSDNGKKVLNTLKQNKGYAVRIWENYLLVSSQSGPTCICVYEKTTLQLITTLKFDDSTIDVTCDAFSVLPANSIVGMNIANDVLYVGDQGANNGVDQVFMVAITDVGKPTVDAYVSAIAARLKKAETTKATETKAPETKAPETKAPETKAPETKTADTKAPETSKPADEKKGCGSSVAYAAVAVVALLGSAVVNKKKIK